MGHAEGEGREAMPAQRVVVDVDRADVKHEKLDEEEDDKAEHRCRREENVVCPVLRRVGNLGETVAQAEHDEASPGRQRRGWRYESERERDWQRKRETHGERYRTSGTGRDRERERERRGRGKGRGTVSFKILA